MANVANLPALKKRQTFFHLLFRDEEGFIALARADRVNEEFHEQFYHYPDELDSALSWIDKYALQYDVYYCPQLFESRRRTKENVAVTTCAWADLDNCPPSELQVEPTVTIESSPGRYQALWVFAENISPADAEDVSRRIAYYHRDQGADTSGWDLTQLLRVPLTHNFKYFTAGDLPTVNIVGTGSSRQSLADLMNTYPQVKSFSYSDIPYPDELPEATPEQLLDKYKPRLMPTAWHLFQEEPEGDWSKSLWQLMSILFEGGMSREEVLTVVNEAACNKWRRDGKPELLWKDVCKAFFRYEEKLNIFSTDRLNTEILSDAERSEANEVKTIVEEYAEWAGSIGDAAPQYHQAGGFIALSSMLAGPVRLPTSFGVMTPNLWFMILADTTLTRKTTAMDMSMDLLGEIDSDAILATDGSIEGLFTALSMRPSRPSVFLRDEFSGLIEQMVKKDYYAGMAETFTKLYDGKLQKRILRKETIEVRDPVLIIYAGGIKSRILQLLTYEHVASGFLPRFIFITAESDISRLRPLGPPTDRTLGQRGEVETKLRAIHAHYNEQQVTKVNGKQIIQAARWDAELTPQAWARYNKFEADMLELGLKAPNSDLMTPAMDRLAKSGLKAAVLLAASHRLGERITVEESDLIKAFGYVEQWLQHTIEVINNIGRSVQENQITITYDAICRRPGIVKSEIMRNYHYTSRDIGMILDTLEQRGMVTRQKHGRSERLYPVGV